MQTPTTEQDAQLFKQIDDRWKSHQPVAGALEREFGLCMSYYEGHGWTRIGGGTTGTTTLEQLSIDQNPDSSTFRVGLNRTSKMAQRAWTSTQPIAIAADVFPPDRDTGIEAAHRAQVFEDVLSDFIDATGMVGDWGNANAGRSINGAYGVGLCLAPSVTRMQYDGAASQAPDCQIETFAFLPMKLVLDPRIEDRDLSKHEYVYYRDVWSINKIKRVFGDKLKEMGFDWNNVKPATFSELSTFELSINGLSRNRMFSQYRNESRTPAAVVWQLHERSAESPYGRFDRYAVVLEFPAHKMVRLTKPDEPSPFGGTGMPFVLIHGHRRPDSMWSIGDVKMVVDDQDRINRAQLSLERQMIKNSRATWVVDRGTLGDKKKPDDIRRNFTNADHGVVLYDGGMGTNKYEKPFLAPHPPPQAFLVNLIETYEVGMREQVHRAAGHFGELKTHTTADAFNRSLDEAAQVLDMRVNEDKQAMAQLLKCLLGTVIKLVQKHSPATLALLQQRGHQPDDLVAIEEADPHNLSAIIQIRDSSIRLRSYTARKQDLDTAVVNKAIDPATYRRELAGMDLSLTHEDRTYRAAFQRFALRVLRGEEWEPLPLGGRSTDLIDEFRLAMLDKRADREAKQRLADAIANQQLMAVKESQMLQLAQPQPEQPMGAGMEGQAMEQEPTEAAFGEMLQQIESQVGMAA